MVTDDQSMASMLKKYFSSAFNTTSGDDTSNTNGNNTNYVTRNASVDRQDAMTQPRNNSSVSASNNTEYPHVSDQQNCVHDHVIRSEHTLQNLEITTEDVLNTLNDKKSNKSPGPDNIYPIILIEAKDEIAGALTSLFNMSLQQGLVPADWKTVNVTPIFKKGNRNIPGNYRPISLTSIVGKMLKSLIGDNIVRYLESYSLIRGLTGQL